MKRRSFKVAKSSTSPYHKYQKVPYKYPWEAKRDRSTAPKGDKSERGAK